MNTSVKKCCICNNKKNGEFILINNEKYHLCCIEQLSQENKDLKSQLRGTTHCYDEEEHKRLEEENKELKKQFEKIDYTIIPNSDIKPLIDKLKNQQKEFINYLENESKEIYRDCGVRQNIFRQILQKYKEIIGGNDVK